MAAKKKSAKKVSIKKTSRGGSPSVIIQFAVVFIIIAAIALVAFAYKNYL